MLTERADIMGKFNNKTVKPKVSSPVTTTGPATTALGASGYARDAKSDLYLLSVSNMVSQKTWHEELGRDERYADLVHTVALDDPAFVCGLFPWLRHEGFMRSASLMGAAEAAKTLCDAGRYDGVEDMVDGVVSRGDEVGEFTAYWFSIAGSSWPRRYKPVMEGLRRAAQRTFTEFNYGKWDSAKNTLRYANLLGILHPAPKDETQSDLFRMILDIRRDNPVDTSRLPMISAAAEWHDMARTFALGKRTGLTATVSEREVLDPDLIKAAGLTWEDVMSALGGHVDKAKIWKAMVPNMGVMALMRNLRNMDDAEIPRALVDDVCRKISDPERVRKSKVFPFRFLSAYRSVQSLNWGQALERGLEASLALVPKLSGSTLILVDRSPSMFPGQWGSTPSTGDISLADQAAVFGAALAVRSEEPTLMEFGGALESFVRGKAVGQCTRKVEVRRGASVLKIVESFGDMIPGTDIPRAVSETFRKGVHDRVVIVTDEQSRPGYLPSNMYSYGGQRETRVDDLIPKNVPVYLWNMAGYKGSILNASAPNRHVFGGLSDASFRMISLLEDRKNTRWPWQQ